MGRNEGASRFASTPPARRPRRAGGSGGRWRPPDGAPSRSLQIGVGTGEDFDQPRFRRVVAFKPLADGLAQMVEGGLDQRRQGAPLVAFAAHRAPPAVHAFAQRGQAVEHSVDNVAIGFKPGAAFVGNSIKLLAAFGRSGDVPSLLQVGQRWVDDAAAWTVPVAGFLLKQFDDFVAVARLLGDQRQRDEAKVALCQYALGAQNVVGAHSARPADAAVAEEATQTEMTATMPASSQLFTIRFEIYTHFSPLAKFRYIFR